MTSHALSRRRVFIPHPKVCKPPPPPPPDPPLPPPGPFAPPTFMLTSHIIGDPGTGFVNHEATYEMSNGGAGWAWTGWGGDPVVWHINMAFSVDDVAHTLILDFMLYPDDWSWMMFANLAGYPITWGIQTSYYIDSWDYIDPPVNFHAEFNF